MEKVLYYGDNLPILRDHIKSESVDLIYLDPPFNSNAIYNVIYKSPAGKDSAAQIEAFTDTWKWSEDSEYSFEEVLKSGKIQAAEMLQTFLRFLGRSDVMAYLSMMAVRLIELHRVLKQTGSIYLHCDPTASHYLKLLMDAVFGAQNFRNEITWKRTSAHSDSRRYGANVDIILFYTVSDKWTWNQIYKPHGSEYLSRFRHKDPDGRLWTDSSLSAKSLSGGGYEYEYRGHKTLWRCPIETMQKYDQDGKLYFTRTGGIRLKKYLDENKGVAMQCLWDDISPINSQAAERLGYATQKPLALLERIIQISSNKGDIVLDPFCGCGTTVAAAQKLKRNWIGIDITNLAIDLIERRLKSAFPRNKFEIIGVPTDIDGATKLAVEKPYEFQRWACLKINAHPNKKGPDAGIDGFIYFKPNGPQWETAIVSVKGGKVQVAMIRELARVREKFGAEIAVFICLNKPTAPMIEEAMSNGFFECEYGKFLRIQIITIEEIIDGKRPKIPNVDMSMTFRSSKAVYSITDEEQSNLFEK